MNAYKKHILFIVENNHFPGDIRVVAEAETVKKLGYKVSVIAPMSKRSTLRYENINGIDVYRHPMPVIADKKIAFAFEYVSALFWEILLSVSIFIKKPFQIIHGANPPDHLFLIALLFKIFGTKYIFDHHDLSPEMYHAKFCKKDILYRALLLMEKSTFNFADIVISTNESYKNFAIERGGKRSDEVFVVRNGPRLDKIKWMTPNEAIKEGFKYLVVYIGAIDLQANIDALLKTIHYIINEKNIHYIKYMIIGTGPHLKEYISLSKKLQLEKYVTFTGFIPYQSLYEILASADVCVNPEFKNLHTDKSTMVKIMDYMSFGKPIVQFETTEGKVTAGDAAAYIKANNLVVFGDTIVDLLNDPDKRKKMGEIGRKRIYQDLNWDKQKVYLKKAYEFIENKYFRVAVTDK